jgi:uncharacterized protein YlxP (DUF503 family)
MEPSFWIGVLTMDLHIPLSQSLKSKRSVLKSMKDRIRSRYNVTVAELDEQDKWQRGVLGVAMIANDKVLIDRSLQHILTLVQDVREAELLNHQVEFI